MGTCIASKLRLHRPGKGICFGLEGGYVETIVELLSTWYTDINSCVRVNGDEGEWFPIRTTLR